MTPMAPEHYALLALVGITGAIIGALVGAVAKAYFDAKAKARKSVTITVEITPILKELSHDGLAVTYLEEPIARLDSYRIRVRNTGNVYLENIPFVFQTKGAIRGEISYKGPDGNVIRSVQEQDAADTPQKFTFENDNQRLLLERSLLNEKESFTVEFLVADGDGVKPENLTRHPGLSCTYLDEDELQDAMLEAFSDVFPLVLLTLGFPFLKPQKSMLEVYMEARDGGNKRISRKE